MVWRTEVKSHSKKTKLTEGYKREDVKSNNRPRKRNTYVEVFNGRAFDVFVFFIDYRFNWEQYIFESVVQVSEIKTVYDAFLVV